MTAVLTLLLQRRQTGNNTEPASATSARCSSSSGGSSGGGIRNSVGSSGSVIALPHTVAVKNLQRLRAVVVMVLRWSKNMRLRALEAAAWEKAAFVSAHAGDAAWVSAILPHDARLGCLARDLALPSNPAEWQPKSAHFTLAAESWDAYALEHFHGRLLPGCSYLCCTNMSGTSEQSLPTLLCGGCRRTRYCSISCQKATWLRGGHSSVCGRDGWSC